MTRLLRLMILPVAGSLMLAACGGNSATGPSESSGGGSAPSSGSAGCVTSVTGLPATVGSSESRTAFTVNAPSSCSWTARADAIWADVAPSSGTGTRSITLTVVDNPSGDSRTTMVSVNDQRHQVRQSGITVVLQPCTYSVSATLIEPASAGETTLLNVTTPSHCSWTASASEGWVKLSTAGTSGSAIVEVRTDENLGGPRSAYATIAGRRVDVRQAGR